MNSKCLNCGCGHNHCRCTRCHPEDYGNIGHKRVAHFERLSNENRPFAVQLDMSHDVLVGNICAYCSHILDGYSFHYILRPCHHSMHADCVLHSMLKMGLTKSGEVYCPLCFY